MVNLGIRPAHRKNAVPRPPCAADYLIDADQAQRYRLVLRFQRNLQRGPSTLTTSMATRPNTRTTGKSGVNERSSCQLWSVIFKWAAPTWPLPKVASMGIHWPLTQTSVHM